MPLRSHLLNTAPKIEIILSSWLNGTFKEFDWSPFFDHVVLNLEGKSNKDARAREALVRKVTKRIVSCDFTAFPMIENGYEGPYDVIISSCCISCCSTMAQFKRNLRNFSAMVKPRGTIMLFQSERRMHHESGIYYAGSTSFSLVNTSASFVAKELEGLGFTDVRGCSCPGDPKAMKSLQDGDLLGFMFVSGVKV